MNGLIPWLLHVENQLRVGPCANNVCEFMTFLGISNPGSTASVYELLRAVVEVIQTPKKQSVTIDQIAALVCARQGKAIIDDDALPAAHQALFCIIGCLTLFFTWSVPASPDEFAITNAGEIQQVRIKAAQRGIGKVLRSFGKQFVLPGPADGLLVCANLNYFTLSVVTKLQLEFVSDMSLHLSFNPVTRKLCIFSYPAFCALWCNPTSDWSYLDGITGDFYETDAAEILRLQFQEILLSLRVLFAYDSKSRNLFFKSYYARFDVGDEDRDFWKRLLAKKKSKDLATLPTYCWPPPVKNNEGALLDQAVFDRSCDFVILGDRLDHLQRYCMRHNPQKLCDMWYDRRNRQQWVTFWAAIIIGATSLLLSAAQVVLSALQLKPSS
ncbi:hypothetical protein V8C37DRAFT_394843 [Trichoderma ceciliae]